MYRHGALGGPGYAQDRDANPDQTETNKPPLMGWAEIFVAEAPVSVGHEPERGPVSFRHADGLGLVSYLVVAL